MAEQEQNLLSEAEIQTMRHSLDWDEVKRKARQAEQAQMARERYEAAARKMRTTQIIGRIGLWIIALTVVFFMFLWVVELCRFLGI